MPTVLINGVSTQLTMNASPGAVMPNGDLLLALSPAVNGNSYRRPDVSLRLQSPDGRVHQRHAAGIVGIRYEQRQFRRQYARLAHGPGARHELRGRPFHLHAPRIGKLRMETDRHGLRLNGIGELHAIRGRNSMVVMRGRRTAATARWPKIIPLSASLTRQPARFTMRRRPTGVRRASPRDRSANSHCRSASGARQRPILTGRHCRRDCVQSVLRPEPTGEAPADPSLRLQRSCRHPELLSLNPPGVTTLSGNNAIVIQDLLCGVRGSVSLGFREATLTLSDNHGIDGHRKRNFVSGSRAGPFQHQRRLAEPHLRHELHNT